MQTKLEKRFVNAVPCLCHCFLSAVQVTYKSYANLLSECRNLNPVETCFTEQNPLQPNGWQNDIHGSTSTSLVLTLHHN